jgi:thermolabile hemolysin
MNQRTCRFGVLLTAVMAWGVGLMAAPVIVVAPRNQAVLLGDAVTLQVEATGVPPLTYRWIRDGDELESATQAKLSLASVTLKELGDYVVVVRDATGETVSRPASILLARWTELAVFDSSISLKSASNGDSWVEVFADRMGLNKAGQVLNYSASGSHAADVRNQITDYLKSHTPGANSLVAPWWAGMTAELALNRAPVETAVSNYVANLTLLLDAGARSFILPTLPPLHLVPGLSNDYTRNLDYADINNRMEHEIDTLRTKYDLTVHRYDHAHLLEHIHANPGAYGFTNLVDAANLKCPPGDPEQFLWWDGVNPTAAFHRLIARMTHETITPVLILDLPLEDGTRVVTTVLNWHGGSPPFRVQTTLDLMRVPWHGGEETMDRHAPMLLMGDPVFFRIQQLGQ